MDLDIPKLVRTFSSQFKVDSGVIAAVILQESAGNPFAIRFEPVFFESRIKPKGRDLAGYVPKSLPTFETEQVARSTSWGLMQLLGETARSRLGFKNPFLSALLLPEVNVECGCKLLRSLLDNFPNLPEDNRYRKALERYNGSKSYPDLIFNHITSGRNKQFLE